MLDRLDKLIQKQVFPGRSQAVRGTVAGQLACLERSRLAQECAKLDPEFEKTFGKRVFLKTSQNGPSTEG